MGRRVFVRIIFWPRLGQTPARCGWPMVPTRCTGKRSRSGNSTAGRPRGLRRMHDANGRNDANALREHLLNLLKGVGAHTDFDTAIAGFPPDLRGAKPAGAPHTAWQLLEHLR